MDQLERIRRMEDVLQRAKAACRALARVNALYRGARLDEALDGYEALRSEVDALGKYYGSELWFYDFDCDRAGLLPGDLPRGVLSEDEAYDLLSAWRELQARASALFGADETPEED